MCNNDNNSACNGIGEILEIICVLQKNAQQCDSGLLDTCDKGFLGQNSATFFNTRPVSLYTCGNGSTPLALPISKDPDETTTSTVFRLEKLDGCCATFRVLTTNPDTTTLFPFVSTNSFFTINLNCVCLIRCLNDTFVDTI